MLQNIREHIQGWVAGVIVVALSITFALWGIQYYIGNGRDKNKAVAKVDGVTITQESLNNTVKRLERQHPEQVVLMDDAARADLRAKALKSLVQEQAQLGQLQKAGFIVPPAAVVAAVMGMPEFKENGQFSATRFQQLLAANRLTEEQYAQQVARTLLVDQPQDGLRDSSIVLKSEVMTAYRLLHQKRDFGYFILPKNVFLKSVQPAKKAMQAYYNDHKTDYTVPEKVQVAYLALSPKAIASQIKVSEPALKQYYQDNVAAYTTPKRWMVADVHEAVLPNAGWSVWYGAQKKMDALVAKLKKGTSFAHLTPKPTTHWVTANSIDAATEKVLADLKPNETSAPFKTKDGWHMIRLVALQAPREKPFSEVKEAVKKAVISQRAEDKFSNAADTLTNMAYTNPTSLAAAASALGLTIHKTPFFSQREADLKGVLANPKVVATAFSEDVLVNQNNSDPIDTKEGGMIVMRVSAHEPAHVPPLAAVKAKVALHVQSEAALKKAQALAKRLQVSVRQGQKPAVLATVNRVIWKNEQAVGMEDKAVPASVLKAAFSLEAPANNTVQSRILSMQNGDIALLVLKAVHYTNPALASAKIKAKLRDQLLAANGELFSHLLMQDLLSRASIKHEKE